MIRNLLRECNLLFSRLGDESITFIHVGAARDVLNELNNCLCQVHSSWLLDSSKCNITHSWSESRFKYMKKKI